jgi:insertion element IS1 protein InsB
MECMNCKAACKKDGKQPNGRQKYRCKACGKYQLAEYSYNACKPDTDGSIISHVKEGNGIWNVARLLHISKATVLARKKRIARGIEAVASFPKDGIYEVDELHTFIGNKTNECYISYAICKATRQVVDYVVGGRTKQNLGRLTAKLLGLEPSRIHTDGLSLYPLLIPREIHNAGKWGTLRIERKNLTLRTNLKRLGRRSICFSRSMEMLEACLVEILEEMWNNDFHYPRLKEDTIDKIVAQLNHYPPAYRSKWIQDFDFYGTGATKGNGAE